MLHLLSLEPSPQVKSSLGLSKGADAEQVQLLA